MSLPPPQKSRQIKIDVISANVIIAALLIFCLGLTFGEQLSILAVILLIVGMVGCLFFQTTTWDWFINKREWFQIVVWFIIDMGVVFMINLVVKTPLPLTGLVSIGPFGSALLGVSEEVLFGAWLTGWFDRMMPKHPEATLLIVASFFVAFHFRVYGFYLLDLMVVFGGRIVLSASIIQTRRIASSSAAHGLINLLAKGMQLIK